MGKATGVETEKRCKIRPLNGWVLIRKVSQELEQRESGLLVDKSQARSQRGIVEAVAEGEQKVAVGDSCIYTNFPLELEDIDEVVGSRDFQLVRSEEIYAVIEPDEC
jgi:co-chaperonin GroES (HSP10)